MTTKVYANDKNEATIICLQCGKSRIKDVSSYKNIEKPLRVKCGCGHIFQITIEFRKFYRKRTNLIGTYHKNGQNEEIEPMVVEDISQGGIGFRTKYKHRIKINDILVVNFVLDNEKKSAICKIVIVKHVNERCVGAQFCETEAYDKEINFYLMPT